jgi:hypothetical protein
MKILVLNISNLSLATRYPELTNFPPYQLKTLLPTPCCLLPRNLLFLKKETALIQ